MHYVVCRGDKSYRLQLGHFWSLRDISYNFVNFCNMNVSVTRVGKEDYYRKRAATVAQNSRLSGPCKFFIF